MLREQELMKAEEVNMRIFMINELEEGERQKTLELRQMREEEWEMRDFMKKEKIHIEKMRR
jgi:hypothetical protein